MRKWAHSRHTVGAWTLLGISALLVLAVVRDNAGELGRTSGAVTSAKNVRYFNLPDGEGQIAVSPASNHDIVVRWHDPDRKAWTDPEVVYGDADRIRTSLRIRVGGPTLAFVAIYTPPDTYDDDESTVEELTADDVTAFVVCRDGSCSRSRAYAGTAHEPPQVTPDGKHAFLAELDGRYVSWHGDGIVEQQPAGLPEGAYGERQPLLAPDGSLRVVHGESGPDGCDFTLLTTEPGRATFTEAARHHRSGESSARCTTTLATFSADHLVVSLSKYDVWFLARTGSTWRVVTADPSGQVRYPRPGEPKLAGAFERSGFWHWREVVASSPDGRTLVAQVHFPGEETWGPAQVVAWAPKGSQCTFIDPMPTYTHGEEDPFYVNLRCRSRPSPGSDWVYTFPTAVTEDGRVWHSFLATASGTRVGRDVFFAGRPGYRWSSESGLRRVDLAVPDGAVVTLLDDGTFALSSLVEVGGGCAVQVRLAGPRDTRWSVPLPSTADPVPSGMCVLDQVQGENGNVYHYFGRSEAEHRAVRLVWRDGEPVVENGPGAAADLGVETPH